MKHQLIKKRIWIILSIILLFSLLNHSQFQKGGIDRIALILVPLGSLVLTYFYALPMRGLSKTEKFLIPLIILPVIYFVVLVVVEAILENIFHDYELNIMTNQSARVLVNVGYYSILTISMIGVCRLYYLFQAEKE